MLFLNISTVYAKSSKSVQILDIEKSEIIKTVPSSSLVQFEAEKFLKEIDSVVKKFKPIPESGYLIKIPLEPSFHLENKWVNTLTDEIIVIIPDDENPYLLTFDDENKSWFFTIKPSISELLNALDFSP
ncbi:MAG: hypothetical protein ACK4M9_22040 [Anaerobacillus sp.]|uniref:hypothetical protein n=1 Tax=Anaerobacillus sp. TaxID=1872506 RepID=UPI003918CA63